MFVVASLIAGATFLVHTFVGSRLVVAPLLAAKDITPASRWMMFYCWHLVTLMLAAMTVGFAFAAWAVAPVGMGLILTVLAGLFALLCLGVAIRARFKPWRIPAFVLFTAMTVAGAAGLLS